MRSYVLSFIVLILTIVVAISSVGIASTWRAVRSYDMQPAGEDLRAASASLARLYRETEDRSLRSSLDGAASRIDDAQAKLSQVDALKGHLYAGFLANIILVAVLCLMAGFLLWLGTVRLFIRPIHLTIREIDEAAGEPGNRRVTLRGVELRFLQASLNDLLEKVGGYQRRILQIERENIGRFLVHQIRNSVTPIRLSASSAKRMAAGSDDIARSMDLVLAEAGKISDLMDRFRILYKFPAITASEIELNALARAIAAGYPGIRAGYAPGNVLIRADRNLLEQAIRNIVQNGIEAAGGNADRVRIAVEEGPPPGLAVSDGGCGMTEEERSRMFDEYYTTKQAGMGIGLAFVKRVAENHGFRILVESRKGQGTSVRMVFHG
jgi:signal transduction histidine kinase